MKAPVWTWEVPVYFFVGGLAGLASVIALVSALFHDEAATAVAARWIAALGAAASPVLLVSDLGKPSRFLYMLRVFKPRSAMSVGAWTLMLFSGAAFATLTFSYVFPSARIVQLLLDALAAASGLVLATYTGVLVGATVIPIWARHHRRLPFEFGVSSLGAAAAAVEWTGGFTSPLNRIAIAAALLTTTLRLVDLPAPLGGRGPATGKLLAGPAALLLRVAGLAWPWLRVPAGCAAVVGSLLSRYEWIAAGRSASTSMRK